MAAGDIQVPFGAGDLGPNLIASIAAAINAANIPGVGGTVKAIVDGSAIDFQYLADDAAFNLNPATLYSSQPPLTYKPLFSAITGKPVTGTGGTITGLTVINNVMYAVDNLGGLYQVVKGDGTAWSNNFLRPQRNA